MIIIFFFKKEKILNLISIKIKDWVELILIGYSEYIKRNNFFLILVLRIIKICMEFIIFESFNWLLNLVDL